MYYLDKLKLIKTKQELEKEYDFMDSPITIIKNLSELAVEENPKFVVMIKFGFWFGVIGYIITLIVSYRRKIESLL